MSRLNLEQQRKRAKDLHRAHAAGDPEAVARIARYLSLQSTCTLSEAQFVVAQEAGFASWPKLKHHIEGSKSPFAGVWSMNVSKSKPHPVNSFQSATLELDVAGDAITMTHVGGDSSVVHVDGKEHPRANPEYVGVASWLSVNVLEVLDKHAGEVVGRGIYEVSPDGCTLTINSADQTLVFDRQ